MAEKKPNIRFKGFEEEWEDKTLGSMGETTSGVGFPIQEQGGKSGIPFFKVSDMNTIGNEREMTASNNYVSSVQIEKNNWKPIQELPAIFFAKIGAALLHNRKRLIKKPFLLDNNTMAYSMNNKEGDFFLSLFETINLPKYAQTGALPSYGETDIKAIEVKVPTICEQRKIGEFFKQLDELIGAKEQELEKLRQIKLALLDKMFPSDNQDNINGGGKSLICNMLQNNSQLVVSSPAPNTPTIRFCGFTEPWENCKLRKLFDFSTPHYSHSRDKLTYEETEVLNIHYGDILILFGDIVDGKEDKIPYIISAKSDNYKASKLIDGDVIFADTAEDETCGKAIEIQNIANKTIVAGLHTFVGRPKKKFAPYFLGYYFNSYTFHDQLLPLMQGIKVLSINKSAVEDTFIYYPTNKEEQRKIGDFFRSQDEAIANSQLQINKLKTIKQACLSQMFA